jgi:menaquinone-9 beta-reductase
MKNQIYDVAIIGGGVAGCAAAVQLAQAGHKVVLCESKSYPHHKVCGEFLSPECAVFLDQLSLMPAIQATHPAQIHTVGITAPNGTTWKTPLPGIGLGISRYALDTIMSEGARSCGVNFRDRSTVTDVQGNLDSAFQLTVRNDQGQIFISAKTIIGAHGKRSIIDRALSRPFLQKPHPFIGLKAHFRGSPLPGCIHLHSFPGGYCGMSEIENGLTNVCLLVRQEIFQTMTPNAEKGVDGFIDWMKAQNPALGKWLSDAQPVFDNWLSIAQIPFVDKQIISNDILMVGDSAGVIAPIAGDGMGMALAASQIASRLLGDYLVGRITSRALRQQYTTLWWRTFGPRLRLSHILQSLMLRPNWLVPGLKLLNTLPVLGRLLVTHTRDAHLIIRSIS